jgi:hypothetical protein
MKVHHTAFMAAMMTSGLAFALQAAPSKLVPVLRMGSAPAIDGKLDDPVWKEAKWQGGFVELGTGKPAVAPTRFAVAHDDRFLYVAIRATEPNLDQLKTNAPTRDSDDINRDNVVELFVAPGPQRTDYYHFEVKSKGVLADAAGRQSGTVRETSWSAAVEAGVAAGQGEWGVEVAVPLADLEPGSSAPGDWGVNVTSARRAGGSEQLATFALLASVQHRIDDANAARIEPGNLAFEDSGVTLMASSRAADAPAPFWLVDGVCDGIGWIAKPFAGADWVELTWPKPQRIGGVVIYIHRFAACEVQVPADGEAKSDGRSLAAAKDATTDPIELTFAPVETKQLRPREWPMAFPDTA